MNVLDRNCSQREGERGMILLLALVLMVVLIGFVGAMIGLSEITTNQAAIDLDKTLANAAAESASEIAVKRILDGATVFLPITTAVSTTSVPAGAASASYSITPVGSSFSATNAAGLQGITRLYTITAIGVSADGVARTTIRRSVAATSSHLFQFGVFYNSDLEVAPTPAMSFAGRIHSNADMYLTDGTSLALNTTYVRAAGSIYLGSITTGRPSGGPITVENAATTAMVSWPAGVDSNSSTFATQAVTDFGGTVESGAMGQQQLAPPPVNTVTPGGYYDQNSGIKITYSGTGLPQVYINGALNSAATNSLNASNALTVSPPSTGGYYDDRQAAYVGLVNINMAALKADANVQAALGGASLSSFNGLLYLSRSDASTTNPNGFRIATATAVPTGTGGGGTGLTIVTPDPIYLQGDFNTTTNHPTVAIISDSVNLLSNAWVDSNKTSSTTGIVNATATTYNMAFATGNTLSTSSSQYSGGLENFPRLHENWSGVTQTVNGSFACLWQSSFATAAWPGTGGNHYQPPNRVWSYDANLQSHSPPFEPQTVRISSNSYLVD